MEGLTRQEQTGEEYRATMRIMPRGGAVLLSDVETPLLAIECEKCGRFGRYRVETLIERFGRDIGLPDLKHRIAADCPRAENYRGKVYDCCGAHYRF
jgi:hypothetical protein